MLDNETKTSHAPLRAMALALGVVLTVGACSGGDDAEAGGSAEGLGTVRVAMVCGGMTPLATMIAIDAETFPDGMEVEKVCFDAGSEAVQALIGGSVDVFMGSTEHILSTQAKGLSMMGYAGINNRAPYALVTAADSDVDSVEDLAGTTVAVTSPGSLSDTELHVAVDDAGVPYDGLSVIGGGSGASMAAAINSGQVSAGMISEPQVSELVASGDYRLVWKPDFEYAAIVAVADPEWVSSNEETMRAFLSGVSDAADQAAGDSSFAVEAMKAEKFPVSDESLTSAVEAGVQDIPEGLVVTEQVYTDTTDVLVGVGVLDQADVGSYDDVFDFSYLPEGK